MTKEDIKTIIDIVHKTIYGFFDVCDEEETPMTDKDKLLLKINKAICTNIKALEQESKWIPVSEYGYPKSEDEYKHFLTIDNKGEITIQEFLLSLDEEPVPYFTGMRNIVAYMPLPEPYKAENEVEV